MSIVIVGGGIQGVCTAYYLLKLYGIKATIIEKTSLACAASGKAGGFLARDWGFESTIPLHHYSYNMHKELAQVFDIKSYRTLTTLSVNPNSNIKVVNQASWLSGLNISSSSMDSETAQVTPYEFCEKLLTECTNNGVNFVYGNVSDLIFDHDNNKIGGVKLESGASYLANIVVLAMGPWTGVAIEDWLSIPFPMEGIKSNSIIFNDVEEVKSQPFACFCDEDKNSCQLELYPRPNNDLYVCGMGKSSIMKGDQLRPGGECGSADSVKPNIERVNAAFDSLLAMTSIVDSHINEFRSKNSCNNVELNACMRPCLSDALPALGKICDGLYSNTGHNCWGILWAPACGKAIAGLIVKDLYDNHIFREEDYIFLNDLPSDQSNFHDIIIQNYKFFDLIYHRKFDPLRFCSMLERQSLSDLKSHFKSSSKGLVAHPKSLSHSISRLFLLGRGRKQGGEEIGEQW